MALALSRYAFLVDAVLEAASSVALSPEDLAQLMGICNREVFKQTAVIWKAMDLELVEGVCSGFM